MDRIVAVKILPAPVMKSPATVARFEREVRAAARIHHPNIVTAFDAGQVAGVHFLVMEYVAGSDLSATVKKSGPFSVERGVNYILQAAKGLDAAHKHGIIHRDIKPGNLLLDNEGTVKILDMGLARLSVDDESGQQADLTNTGQVMGTVDYMSPEQALDSKTADARADIYSLGCTLFYLLTGKATYQGDTLMKKLLAHREHAIPSIRAMRPEVPERVEAVFSKMVAKNVGDRYQKMADVIADLQACETGHEQPASTQQPFASATDEGLTNFLKEISFAAPPSAVRKKTAGLVFGPRKRQLFIGAAILGVLVLLCVLGIIFKSQDGPRGALRVTKASTPNPGNEEDGPEEAESGRWLKTIDDPAFQKWEKQVATLPAVNQVEVVAAKLKELNPGLVGPGFDGKVAHQIDNGVVTELQFDSDSVTDIAPVRALHGLKRLQCGGTVAEKGRLFADLSPLKGMQLASLVCGNSQVSDLSPLVEMPLTRLQCGTTRVSDLSPLRGLPLTELSIYLCTEVTDLTPLKDMKLTSLDIGGSRVTNLSPLNGMPLTTLGCSSVRVSDLSPLAGMPLTTLNLYNAEWVNDLKPLTGMPLTTLICTNTRIADLSVLRGLPLTTLHCDVCPNITDLSPLNGMPLKDLSCDLKPFRDIPILRSLTALETLNGKPVAEFWKQVDIHYEDKKR
jgi:Leucine-rich repeat (LRR) protein